MKIDGIEIKIGDWVSFKSDIEQSGQVVAFKPNGWIALKNENGFDGGYIGGDTETTVHSSDCWVE